MPKKGVFFGVILGATTWAELLRVIGQTAGLLYYGGDKTKRESMLHRFLGFTNHRGFETP